jgi:hypothetical protein
MTTKAAVRQLVKALTSDPEYRESWKANIAMAFRDEWSNANGDIGLASVDKDQAVHLIANKAADNFLNLFCREE